MLLEAVLIISLIHSCAQASTSTSTANVNLAGRPSCLSRHAVPSLVILGAAKGGTTDVWDMLTTFHVKFNNPQRRPWKIEKEVNLLAHSLCTNYSDSISGRDRGKEERCTATVDDVYIMLQCQRKLAIQENFTACKEFFETQQQRRHHRYQLLAKQQATRQHQSYHPEQGEISPLTMHGQSGGHISPLQYEYTATARPTLFFLYTRASQLFRQLTASTHTPSMFMVLLRHPVDRAVSLYNHGQMLQLALHPDVPTSEVLSIGYSLPLEDVLSIEFDLLFSSSECKRLLDDIHLTSTKWDTVTGGDSKGTEAFLTDMQHIGISFDRLRQCMSTQLREFNSRGSAKYPLPSSTRNKKGEEATSSHLANLRPFGLLLEGLYGAQLSGWLASGLFSIDSGSNSRSGAATPLLSSPSSRILIAQSEYLFQDRFKFFNTVLLPFLHPAGCATLSPATALSPLLTTTTTAATTTTTKVSPHIDIENSGHVSYDQKHIILNSYITNGTSLSQIMRTAESTMKNNRKQKKRNKIANQKLNKLPSSVLSPYMKQRLLAFYNNYFPLSNLLQVLTKLHDVKEGDVNWGSSENNNFFTVAPRNLKSWW